MPHKNGEVQMSKKGKKPGPAELREGKAAAHKPLVDDRVHIFVDDQNLFWGIVNEQLGRGYRLDFGRLLSAACKKKDGTSRFVKSAYIAGVIPDDDSFWKVAESQGFTVRRGYLGSAGGGRQRSKQDDAYLITDMTATLYEQAGPSTIVLVAGDADYVPPLLKAIEKGWRVEVVFLNRGLSSALDPVTHEFRVLNASNVQYFPPGSRGAA
jgi:uncharacterized LabA/DUF88 family protein